MSTRPIRTDLDARVSLDAAAMAAALRDADDLIGVALKEARDYAGLTQAQVAEAMNVTRSRVTQIETLKGVNMTLDVLARYVEALCLRLDIDIVDPETEECVSQVPVIPIGKKTVAEDSLDSTSPGPKQWAIESVLRRVRAAMAPTDDGIGKEHSGSLQADRLLEWNGNKDYGQYFRNAA